MKTIIQSFKSGFQEFGETISVFVNSLLLLMVYLLGVGITSVTAKVTGKQFLNLNKTKADTYWQDLNLTTQPIEKYYRQF